ncbi:unnamed protein product [Ilex paraguariensis]|uniref:Uncharacterized protein n=1 Tax=Ilex paraguariensis TaxID=185542 RepID=A0ABC8UZB4_9AQUA
MSEEGKAILLLIPYPGDKDKSGLSLANTATTIIADESKANHAEGADAAVATRGSWFIMVSRGSQSQNVTVTILMKQDFH